MKKVLIISSSPRKGGNSDGLCDEFLSGAVEAGNEVEKIRLADYRINYCTGCGVCNTAGKCAQSDDMAQVAAKMNEAEVIVFASPVYFYTVCGQMKTMIDRCCAYYTGLKNKEFYYILTAADGDAQTVAPAVEDYRAFLYCLDEPQEKGILLGLGVWGKGDAQKSVELMRRAYEMGAEI